MKRWIVRIFITLLVLLLLAAGAIEIILQTSFPRKALLAQLESTLQLRFTAASVHTGMFGRTELSDVTLSLPLATDSFLKVKTLRVHHTNIPALLLGRDLVVDSLEFDEPMLKVNQDSEGRWNIVQVAELLRRAAGGKQTTVAAHPEIPKIPQIVLSNGTVVVTDRALRTATLHPLNMRGAPQGVLVWQFNAGIGDSSASQLAVSGDIVPGGDWQHRVELTLHEGAAWMAPWLTNETAQQVINRAHLQATWQGAVGANGVNGALTLHEFKNGDVSASGTVNALFQNGLAIVSPSNLRILGLPMLRSGVELKSGQVTLGNASVHTQDLIATAFAGDVRINGNYSWALGSADLSVGWHNLIYPENSTQNGSLNFAMRTNWPGILRVDGQINSSGKMPAVSWDSQLTLTGIGSAQSSMRNALQSIAWTLDASKLNVAYAGLQANLDHLTAKFTNTLRSDSNPSPQLTLDDLSIPVGQLTADRPRGTLTGHGIYKWPEQGTTKGGYWKLAVGGAGWRIFNKRQITADFDLDLSGDINAGGNEWAQINRFTANTNTGIRTTVTGRVNYGAQAKTVELKASASYPPFILAGYANEEALRGGVFSSDVQITGALEPINLQISGGLKGASLRIGKHPVGDVSMAVVGEATGDLSTDYAVHLKTQHLRLFEGDWDLDARYTSNNEQGIIAASLSHMSMAAIDQFVNPPPKLSGDLTGQWTILLPRLALKQAIIEGDFRIENLRGPKFATDHVAAQIHTNPNHVLIDHIKAIRDGGGEIDADINLPIATPHDVQVNFAVSKWPWDFANGSCLVNASTQARLQVDLSDRKVSGPIEVTLIPTYRKRAIGTLHGVANLQGRTAYVGEVDGNVFGGALTGKGAYDFDHLANTRADLTWHDVDSTKIEDVWPSSAATTEPATFTGNVAGSLKIGPPEMARPLAPLAMELKINSDRLQWHNLNFTAADLKAYYDPGTKIGEERLIFDNSSLNVAGGVIQLFFRLTRHPLSRATMPTGSESFEWSYNLLVDASHLDLNTLVHAGNPKAADQPGLLSVRATLLGDPLEKQQWIGDATASIRKSDLAGNSVLQLLYAAMSVQLGKRPPTGDGTVSLHFEKNNLIINSFYYSDRGVDAQGNGTIIDLWKGPNAGLDGYVVGTARPFRDLKLPFAADVDKVLAAASRNATPVRVVGTLGKPDVKLMLFSDIGDALKALIVGEVHGDNNPDSSAP